MASNISSGSWSVKMSYIPASITVFQLAQKIDLPNSRIRLLKGQNDNTRYAWVNDFGSEEEAKNFVREWSGSSFFGQTIKCVVAARISDEADAHHSPHESSVSVIETLSDEQDESRPDRGVIGENSTSMKQPLHPSHRKTNRQQQHQTFNQVSQQQETLGK